MRFWTKALLILFLSHASYAKPITIAVIDTGFGYKERGHQVKLCKYGHKDFTIDKQLSFSYDTQVPIPIDIERHGTNIVGIIDDYLRNTNIDYCLVIIKFYSRRQSGEQNILSTIRSMSYAINIGADYVNYSAGGPERNRFEEDAVKRFLDGGGKLVAAAGNEGLNLDLQENAYYPAMYDPRIIVVGNLGIQGVRYSSSNYGSVVTKWEIGTNVTEYGITMTGTSQATALETAKTVAKESKLR